MQLEKIRVHVVSQEKYDEGPFFFGGEFEEGTLKAVINSLEEIRNSIPEEYRDKASCEINSVSGYEGSHYAQIAVFYTRLETPEERNKRLEYQIMEQRHQQQKQLNEYLRLKAIYEGGS